jgi:hypothetical protein
VVGLVKVVARLGDTQRGLETPVRLREAALAVVADAEPVVGRRDEDLELPAARVRDDGRQPPTALGDPCEVG